MKLSGCLTIFGILLFSCFGQAEIRLPFESFSNWNCRIACLPSKAAEGQDCARRPEGDHFCNQSAGELAYRKGSCNSDIDEQWLSCPSSGEHECLSQAKRTAWAKDQGVPMKSFDWSSMKSKKIVFVADIHTYTNPQTLLKVFEVLRQENKKQCALFEVPSGMTREDFLKDMAVKEGQYSELRKRNQSFREMYLGAEKLGFHNEFVDHPMNFRNRERIPEEIREAVMKERIESLFRSGTCDSTIMVIGEAHIAPESPRKTLMDQLAGQFTTGKINLTYANELSKERFLQSWNGLCQQSQYTPPGDVVFPTYGIKEQRLHPFYDSVGSYGDFDISILTLDQPLQ